MEKTRARAWRQHSILFALLALMVGFELLGRLLASEVLDAFSQARTDGSWQEVGNALWASLTRTDLVFLSPRNLTNLVLQVSVNGILAVGMTLVILTGGIDLSVGSVVALCGVILGLCDQRWGTGPAVALLVAGASGLAAGSLNGFMIARFKIPPFVITLGMLVIARGLALILSDSSAIAPLSAPVRFMGGGFLPSAVMLFAVCFVALAIVARRKMSGKGTAVLKSLVADIQGLLILLPVGCLYIAFSADRGLPFPALLMAVVAALGIFLTRATTFGRSLYAVGGNEQAAVLSGINVPKTKMWVYAIMGLCAALSGSVLAGRLNSATPTEGQLLELDAIASVVIGGASLQGGYGRVQGAIIGAFIIGALNNGMDMLEISSNWQMIAKGLIIVFAVYSDAKLRQKS